MDCTTKDSNCEFLFSKENPIWFEECINFPNCGHECYISEFLLLKWIEKAKNNSNNLQEIYKISNIIARISVILRYFFI